MRELLVKMFTEVQEGKDFESARNDCLSQLSSIQERQEFHDFAEKVKSVLAKGKYMNRDYSPSSIDSANNARRKSKNLEGGSTTGIAASPHVKPYGGSGPSAASKETKTLQRISAKNPTHVRHPETGKITDILHSSGKNKGKSIFKTPQEREAHLSNINKSTLDALSEILEKAKNAIDKCDDMKKDEIKYLPNKAKKLPDSPMRSYVPQPKSSVGKENMRPGTEPNIKRTVKPTDIKPTDRWEVGTRIEYKKKKADLNKSDDFNNNDQWTLKLIKNEE